MSKLTQEQIDALPSPQFTPARDMMLCERIVASMSGIIFSADEDASQTVRVLRVGPGLQLDDGKLKRCPYERGQRLFISPQDGYPITMNGVKYWLVEVAEVMGEITDETVMAFGRDVC